MSPFFLAFSFFLFLSQSLGGWISHSENPPERVVKGIYQETIGVAVTMRSPFDFLMLFVIFIRVVVIDQSYSFSHMTIVCFITKRPQPAEL